MGECMKERVQVCLCVCHSEQVLPAAGADAKKNVQTHPPAISLHNRRYGWS